MKEIYKVHKKWKHYQVSNLGNVMRLTKLHGWVIQNPVIGTGGMRYFNIYHAKTHRGITVCNLAKTVWELFGEPLAILDNPSLVWRINFKDGNKGNCRLDNLEWKLFNMGKYYHRRIQHYNPLTQKQGRQIFQLHRGGMTYREIAKRFKISPLIVTYLFNEALGPWRKK